MKTIITKIKSENIKFKLEKHQQRISNGEIEVFTNKVKTIFNKKEHIFTNEVKKFNLITKINYSKTNMKSLKYAINNLCILKYEDSTNNIFKLDQYMKYMRKDSNGNYYLEDEKNEYLQSQDKQRNQKIFSKVNYIDFVYTTGENGERIPAFITISLPSKYHFYKKKYPHLPKSTILIPNPKRGFSTLGATIEATGKKLQEINRYISKMLKEYFKRAGITLDYGLIKVLEQHSNKSFHLHALGYFTKEQLEIFYKVFELAKEKFDLEQTDVREITREGAEKDNQKYATPTSYIMKYILKDQLFGEVRKYCSNFKVFTCTNFQHTNQKELDRLYSYMNNKKKSNKENKKILEDWIADKTIPLYYKMEQYLQDNFIVEYKKVENYDNDRSLKKIIDKKVEEYIEDSNKEVLDTHYQVLKMCEELGIDNEKRQDELLLQAKEKLLASEENLQKMFEDLKYDFIDNITFDFIDDIVICDRMKMIKKIDFIFNKHTGEVIYYSDRKITKTENMYKIK